jgi:hypothetical protein
MSNIEKITKYCTLPPNTVAAGHDVITHSFYAITEPHKVKVQVSVPSPEVLFFKTKCINGCPFYKTQNEIVDTIKRQNLVPTEARIITYCENNNVCNGSVLMQQECKAGHILTTTGIVEVEKELPYLLWVWSYKAKGKQQWRLYYVHNFNYSDPVSLTSDLLYEEERREYKIYPYLLPNVYSNPAGSICWKMSSGSSNNKIPKDIIEAYYTFFNSPFTNETTPPNIEDLVSYTELYDPLEDELSKPEIFVTNQITNWITPKSDKVTLMYSNEEEIINTFPNRVVGGKDSIFVELEDTETPTMFLATLNEATCLKTGKLKGKSVSKLLYLN